MYYRQECYIDTHLSVVITRAVNLTIRRAIMQWTGNIRDDLGLYPVCTVQPVVKPVVQPVWQPVVSCKRGISDCVSDRLKLTLVLIMRWWCRIHDVTQHQQTDADFCSTRVHLYSSTNHRFSPLLLTHTTTMQRAFKLYFVVYLCTVLLCNQTFLALLYLTPQIHYSHDRRVYDGRVCYGHDRRKMATHTNQTTSTNQP